jgi:tetrahydromethanopterin S-methyltransferase subunit E
MNIVSYQLIVTSRNMIEKPKHSFTSAFFIVVLNYLLIVLSKMFFPMTVRA